MVVVVISGLSGVGKTTVAKRLAEYMKYEYFSVGNAFKKYGSGSNSLSKSLSVWETRGKNKEFHYQLDNLQLQVADNDNVVIDGKISIFVFRNFDKYPCFKVWLYCDRETRIKRIAERDGLKKSEVKELLDKKEKYEKEMFKKIYNIDIGKLDAYADVSIDTTELPVDEIVNKIIRMMPK